MFPTNANRGPRPCAGFSLAELVVALALSAVVLAGVLTGYTFLGRNLARMGSMQQLETAGRRTFDVLTQDVSAATQISAGSNIQLVLQVPSGAGSITVTYDYNAADGSLTRGELPAGTSRTLLTNLSASGFNYFNNSGTAIPAGLNLGGIKAVELAFTSALGLPGSPTRVTYSAVSPRVTIRNKSLLVPL